MWKSQIFFLGFSAGVEELELLPDEFALLLKFCCLPPLLLFPRPLPREPPRLFTLNCCFWPCLKRMALISASSSP